MILIFGGASGIGLALAEQLAGQGRSLKLLGRDSGKLDAAHQRLGCAIQVCDARSFEQVDEAFGSSPPVEGAVCCAGSILLKPAHLTSEKELEDTLDANLKTAFAVVRAAAKHMPKGGPIVLFSSAAARIGLANHEAVAAAKGAVEALARSAAATYAARGLRFNVIAPGLVDTPLAARITSRPAARQASEAQHPLGRLGQPGEVASLACWLLGEQATWVTGQVFAVDGGLSTVKKNT